MKAVPCFLIIVLCCALHATANLAENLPTSSDDWVPSSVFPKTNNNSNYNLTNYQQTKAHHHNTISQPRVSARSFLINQIETKQSLVDYEISAGQQQDFKAVPFIISNPSHPIHVGSQFLPQYQSANWRPDSLVSSNVNSQVPALSYFQSHSSSSYLPPPSQSYGVPSQSYLLPSQTYMPPPVSQIPEGYQYPTSQYQPLPLLPLESFELLQSLTSAVNESALKINSKGTMFVQPGRCSNSIEVGRVRDVEVETTIKYGPEGQRGICVLMLYAANELNKVALSLQPVKGTINIVPSGSWLQTNVKIYTTQAGNIQPISTNFYFDPGSPALILTKSSIVLISFVIDRAVDFLVDISTYQSHHC